MKIFLIGYRCTGKTTIGQILAKSILIDFIDIDQIIEKESKLNIALIVKKYGWDYFRSLEKKALFNTKYSDNLIVATGGGIVMDHENLNFIKNSGFCIWLDADIKTILKRLQNDAQTALSRPSLTDNTLLEETKKLLNSRKPLYEKSSHMKIDTAGKTPHKIVNIIEKGLKDVRQHHRQSI